MKTKNQLQFDRIVQWLKKPPRLVDENADASQFVPIGVVEDDLTELDSHWSSENFKFRVFEKDGVWYISSSLELVVTYNGRTRRITGASTVRVESDATIESAEPISLSESLKNASKKLGQRFGSHLNGRMDYIRGKETVDIHSDDGDNYPTILQKKYAARNIKNSVLMPPDKEIRKKYAKAVADKNFDEVKRLETIYTFQIG